MRISRANRLFSHLVNMHTRRQGTYYGAQFEEVPMIVAIVQARMGSSRLPGKVMMEIVGKPALWHLVNRLSRAQLVDKIVIATPDKEENKPILRLAQDLGVGSFAGSEEDVLDRYFQVAKRFNADVIVRITADCPLVDCHVVDKVIRRYLEGDCDCACNTLKRTYPDGLDVSVFSFQALAQAWEEAKWASEREYVTSYIYKNPDKFRVANVVNDVDLSHLRWTVDEDRDLEFVREIYQHLYQEGEVFGKEDVLRLLEEHPELLEINRDIVTRDGFLQSLGEDKIVR